jgi:hypothetical protein
MKFLVETWPDPAAPPGLPAAASFEAQTEWFRAHLANGVIDVAHHAPGRALFVFNAASLEALEALIAEIPLAERMAAKFEPLADFWEHTASVTAYLRKLEASEVG